jgi:hypothetical protein
MRKSACYALLGGDPRRDEATIDLKSYIPNK